MAQNKLENQIREKLNSREIQPSAQAWDRLDAMLTVGEEKKTKRSFFSFKYIGIAASVLVFVTLGLFFFNQKNTTIEQQNTVVESDSKKQNTKESVSLKENAILGKDQNTEVIVSNEKMTTNKSTSETRNFEPKNSSEVSIINQKNNQSQSLGTIINREKEIEYMIGEAIGIKDLPIIESPTKVFISKKSNSKKPSYIDVDELLASVEKDREKETKVSKSNINVDAKSLLSEVDTELDMTFRQRVLNTVNKNYKSVKEAVVNRNH
ncbi:hypothetical protein [Flavobacterium dankookense]|uniref:Uncharacterized protein n=1 Tax=Flavobacterium dankookense TaxID=706186 RepID=A0A4R6Q7Y1_9FLAO|nr:hypothetical protein [Flavobacterium dankookense]TDP58215.1 hypothetical protein BC748_2248 [Flavobacterium dankookense]